MNEDEYKDFLNEITASLPAWATELSGVDLTGAKMTASSRKKIVEARNLGLAEVRFIRDSVADQRQKRTVSGEVTLWSYLQALYDTMDSIALSSLSVGITQSSLQAQAPQLKRLIGQIATDASARVESLEAAQCSVQAQPGTQVKPKSQADVTGDAKQPR